MNVPPRLPYEFNYNVGTTPECTIREYDAGTTLECTSVPYDVWRYGLGEEGGDKHPSTVPLLTVVSRVCRGVPAP